MIQKYYNSILEQVFAQIGKKEHNIVLAKYSNDFSLKQLEISEQILNNKEVHFEMCIRDSCYTDYVGSNYRSLYDAGDWRIGFYGTACRKNITEKSEKHYFGSTFCSIFIYILLWNRTYCIFVTSFY